MTTKQAFRSLIGLVVIIVLVFSVSWIATQTARAQDAPPLDDIPGTRSTFPSDLEPLDNGLAPDGKPLSDLLTEPLTNENSASKIHSSGILGLGADQEIPIRRLNAGIAGPQGLISPGDGLFPPIDSSTNETTDGLPGSLIGLNELSAIAINPGQGFLQNSRAGNVTGYASLIDLPVLNNRPAQMFLATPVLDPGDESITPYHDHPLGAYYSSSYALWSVFNEDQVGMVADPTFNVFSPAQNGIFFTHSALIGNITNDLTVMDHASLNNKPNALVFALPVYNPNGVTAGPGYYNHHIGAYYSPAGEWGIYNEDQDAVTVNSAFFVYVANPAVDIAFKHTTTTGDITSNYTTLNHPLLNGNPNAVVLVQHVYSSGNRFDHNAGVWYNRITKRWTIYDNSYAGMAVGQVFNVLVIPNKSDTFVYKALSSRILPDANDHVLRIDHPLLDGNPNAHVYVAHNWNPLGDDNHIVDSHPLGVVYFQGHWNVYHTDFEPIQVGATYNIYATYPQLNSYSTMSSGFNTAGSTLFLNHPSLNNLPGSIFIETLNYSPGEGVSGFSYPYATSAYYYGEWWSINRNVGPNYSSNAHNILIPDGNKFIHTTTPGNQTSSYDTCIDNQLTNGRRSAVVMVTANGSPNGAPAPIVNSPLGVYYHVEIYKWCIYTEDFSVIPLDAGFNVFVGPSKVFLPLIAR